MWDRTLAAVTLVAGASLLMRLMRLARNRDQARQRLAGGLTGAAGPAPVAGVRPFVRPHRILPWLAAAGVAAACHFLLALPPAFVFTAGLLIGLGGWQMDAWRVTRLKARIEVQLADAIDLMVGALKAGGSVMSALENAVRESRPPLQPQLDEVLGRIRLGEDPQTALQALTRRVPVETFLLFASALAVHWEVGGSVAGTLSTVGRAIRDRIELSRRVGSLTAQARFSVFAVMVVTYFIAAIIWRNNPDRMRQFLATTIGQALIAGALVLQALGVVWSILLSRVRY
jgi:tight adherence protein B